MRKSVKSLAIHFAFTSVFLMFVALSARADELNLPARLSQATVYVPVYSHIYIGDSLRPYNLAVTVSIRNTDPQKALEVTQADYINSKGNRLRALIESPISIAGLSSHSLKIKESDVEGGSGASVILSWRSAEPITKPIIESVMIGASSAQGISFTSRGEMYPSPSGFPKD